MERGVYRLSEHATIVAEGPAPQQRIAARIPPPVRNKIDLRGRAGDRSRSGRELDRCRANHRPARPSSRPKLAGDELRVLVMLGVVNALPVDEMADLVRHADDAPQDDARERLARLMSARRIGYWPPACSVTTSAEYPDDCPTSVAVPHADVRAGISAQQAVTSTSAFALVTGGRTRAVVRCIGIPSPRIFQGLSVGATEAVRDTCASLRRALGVGLRGP